MATYKKILTSLVVLSVIAFAVGFVFIYPHTVGLCAVNDRACAKNYPALSWGEPLSFGSILPLIIFIILFFTPESFFRAWRWFALFFGVVSVFFILITPPLSQGIISFDKEYVTWAMSILFFITSLCIILYQTFKYNHNKGLKK